jgi:sporulation protein YlmC with PRC-barrel domain
MAHIGTLRDFKFKGEVDDIRGAHLYGRGNEKLGKVDDVVFDHAGGTIQYLVVDTGGWLRSNKFLVPADRVNARGDTGEDFTCDLTKAQIERFPEYKDSIIRSNADWQAYEERYRGSYSSEGDVLHREGSDHLITPEASELPPSRGDADIDSTPTRLVDKFSSTEPSSDKTRLRPSGTAARVEDAKNPGRALENESAAWTEQGATSRNRRATDRPLDEDIIISDRDASEAPYLVGESERFTNPYDATTDPAAYRAGNDLNSRIGSRYASNRRLADFEETLRRNRVDITATCRACGVEHDESEHRRKDEDAA